MPALEPVTVSRACAGLSGNGVCPPYGNRGTSPVRGCLNWRLVFPEKDDKAGLAGLEADLRHAAQTRSRLGELRENVVNERENRLLSCADLDVRDIDFYMERFTGSRLLRFDAYGRESASSDRPCGGWGNAGA